MKIKIISTKTGHEVRFTLFQGYGTETKDVIKQIQDVIDEMDGEAELFVKTIEYGLFDEEVQVVETNVASVENLEGQIKRYLGR